MFNSREFMLAVDQIEDNGLDYETRINLAAALMHAYDCLTIVAKYKGRNVDEASSEDRFEFDFHSTSLSHYANKIGLDENEIFKLIINR